MGWLQDAVDAATKGNVRDVDDDVAAYLALDDAAFAARLEAETDVALLERCFVALGRVWTATPLSEGCYVSSGSYQFTFHEPDLVTPRRLVVVRRAVMRLRAERPIPREEWPAADRASGDARCDVCTLAYRHHPMATDVPDAHGDPFLTRLCDGELVKL